ncbi:MAG TPA: TQO small subunit DoxD [Chloroflexota bacterium]|nr:TQO small subunit DoxD [Chloroflexota bacterium]
MRDYRLWMALLRLAVGGVWLFEAYPQVTSSSSYLNQGFATAVQGMAAGNPWQFYRHFLEAVVLTHASVFSYLTLVGNALVGLCLVLGLLTPYSAFVGIILNVNYALAAGWMMRSTYELNGLLLVSEMVIIALAAGQVAGIDALFTPGPERRHARRY